MAVWTVDLSKWDGDVSIPKLKEAGVGAVIAKCGGGDVGLYRDSKWESNYANCKAAGMPVGAYFYSAATTVNQAIKEAEYALKLLEGKQLEYPVYIDVEEKAQQALPESTLRAVIKAWLDTIGDGWMRGVYTWAWLMPSGLDCETWFCAWTKSKPAECGMWQFGGETNQIRSVYVAGYGPMDQSYAYKDYPTIIKKAGLNGFSKKEKDVAKNGTIEAVMNAAYGELGYYAPSDPKPGSKYGRWMTEITGESWLSGPSTEIWWCCMFVSWCLNKGGVKCPGFPTYNTDVALRGGARKKTVSKTSIRRGDIIIFDWDWNGATDHIGFATGPYDGYGFPTIEGNVGNAVKEKYRNLGNVAYVIRPDYSGSGGGSTTPSVPTDPKNNRDGGKLEVDGIGGWNTVIDLQHALGTGEDGVISGQSYADKDYHWAMSAVEYGTDGSLMVKALQKKIGATQDGFWGKDTSTKLQQWLKKKGYSLAVDGYFGHESVKALQKSLNDGKWS